MAKSNQPSKPQAPSQPSDPALPDGAPAPAPGQDQGTGPSNDPRTLTITLPEDLNDGITLFVDKLREVYVDAGVDQALVDRFKPETQDAPESEPRDVLLVTGFELAFPMEHLAANLEEGVVAVQKALDSRMAPEGTTFPHELAGFQFSLTVLERYVAGVLSLGKRLEDAELVFADPATDLYLKALNFQRHMQGLPETYLYLRML